MVTTALSLLFLLAAQGTPAAGQELPPMDTECAVPGLGADAPPDAVARCNGRWILLQDVDARIESELRELEEALVEARMQELYLLINSKLLEQAAARDGISSVEYLERHLRATVQIPTEEDARVFYQDNADRLQGDFERLLPDILQELQRFRQSEAAEALVQRLRAEADLEIPGRTALLDGLPEDPSTLLARVGAEMITGQDLAEALRPAMAKVQQQLYDLRRENLEILVNDRLLEAAAAAQGLPIPDYLTQEIRRRSEPITEMHARQFHDRNRDRLDVDVRTPEGLKAILDYLQRLELTRVEEELAAELRAAAEVVVALPPPGEPESFLDPTGQPSLGPEDAPVTLVAFVDYECTTCAWLHGNLDELLVQFPGRLRIVAREFPMERHPRAMAAALAAEAAFEQGRYWEYSKELFAKDNMLLDSDLRRAAERVGLDMDLFRQALAGPRPRQAVERDREHGTYLGITETPSVYVNGTKVALRSATSIQEAIRAALDAAPER